MKSRMYTKKGMIKRGLFLSRVGFFYVLKSSLKSQIISGGMPFIRTKRLFECVIRKKYEPFMN